jgi:hypothetical protein
MINDYSEITCTLNKKVHDMNAAFESKNLEKAKELLDIIVADLVELYDFILNEVSK